MSLTASMDIKGFVDLIAKQALFILVVISLICCFHNRFESNVIPRNYIFWAFVICLFFTKGFKIIVLNSFRVKLKKVCLINTK
jgi:hypothetical protein